MGRTREWLTIANIVTLIRLGLVIPVVYALLQDGSVWEWSSLFLSHRRRLGWA